MESANVFLLQYFGCSFFEVFFFLSGECVIYIILFSSTTFRPASHVMVSEDFWLTNQLPRFISITFLFPFVHFSFIFLLSYFFFYLFRLFHLSFLCYGPIRITLFRFYLHSFSFSFCHFFFYHSNSASVSFFPLSLHPCFFTIHFIYNCFPSFIPT